MKKMFKNVFSKPFLNPIFINHFRTIPKLILTYHFPFQTLQNSYYQNNISETRSLRIDNYELMLKTKNKRFSNVREKT